MDAPAKKKVLIAITKANFGGAQRYVYDIALGARTAGHSVTVLCGKEGLLVDKLRAEGIRIISLPHLSRDISFFGDLRSILGLFMILKEERPDVLHLNSSKMGGLGGLIGRMVGIKRIIFTAHGLAFNEDRPWLQKLIIKKVVWYTVMCSHTTICVSEKLKRDLRFFPFIKSKLVVIHNGIDPFPLSERRETIFTVGTLSELHHTKGLDILLRSFAKAFKGKPARLVILGEGEKRRELKGLAEDLGIEHQVHFSGFMPNAREELTHFDVFALTSRTEGLPYVLLEAGIASLPVVASRVGGIPEVIIDNETGLLFEKENIDACTDALKKLFDTTDLRKKLGEHLHTLVLNDFSLKEMLRRTLALY